jgi:hypothetical protein
LRQSVTGATDTNAAKTFAESSDAARAVTYPKEKTLEEEEEEEE